MRKFLPLLMVVLLMGLSRSFAQIQPSKKAETAAPASGKAGEASTNRSASYDSDDDGLGEEMQRAAPPRPTPPAPPPPPRPAASKEEKPAAPAEGAPKSPR